MGQPTSERMLAHTLADFASGLSFDRIPAEVRTAALWHMVDSIGVCIAGASPREESGQAAAKLARQWAGPGASVIGIGSSVRPEMAALLNGALAQALEMDDKHGSSLARPGSTVTPAVLAVAQANGLDLADAITAVTVGYEVMIRLGFVAGDRFLERGYHTSSLLGGFGTVAAIGSLLKATPAEIVDALGIVGTFAAGIQEATRTGSTSKILHGGWGAHSGILALDLARAGITGPASVFEGKFGFFSCFLTPITGALDFAIAAEGLGSRWYTPETAYKPYPCCQLLHAFIEGGKQIRAELRADGVGLDAIERISCQLAEPGLTLVTEPKDRKLAPSHPHEARFSLPYGVATTLVHGDVDVESFRVERLSDPVVRRIAALVVSSEDPDSDYPQHCPAILEVTAKGKLYRRHVRFHPGSPEAALTPDDVLDKFARNASWLFGPEARAVGAALTQTAESAPVDALFRRIAAEAARRPVAEAV
ncbi:MmgE/PrpD family protein [Aquabacter spiritensis]|uniref:2-methylcitrate dehydratase PrpD n=1 Tax=Aquabacter spiritensis TaxID=933073 RepID=A0A4R3LXH0_9HYPH|nr:MmgE/PrpD family protein [Aquabacter spiritensis]TCT03287.1 2-methylcitrate dehydratase PrpD [Aquabacter spiritensis]